MIKRMLFLTLALSAALTFTSSAREMELVNETNLDLSISINNGTFLEIDSEQRVTIDFVGNPNPSQGFVGLGENIVTVYPQSQGPSSSDNFIFDLPTNEVVPDDMYLILSGGGENGNGYYIAFSETSTFDSNRQILSIPSYEVGTVEGIVYVLKDARLEVINDNPVILKLIKFRESQSFRIDREPFPFEINIGRGSYWSAAKVRESSSGVAAYETLIRSVDFVHTGSNECEASETQTLQNLKEGVLATYLYKKGVLFTLTQSTTSNGIVSCVEMSYEQCMDALGGG